MTDNLRQKLDHLAIIDMMIADPDMTAHQLKFAVTTLTALHGAPKGRTNANIMALLGWTDERIRTVITADATYRKVLARYFDMDDLYQWSTTGVWPKNSDKTARPHLSLIKGGRDK